MYLQKSLKNTYPTVWHLDFAILLTWQKERNDWHICQTCSHLALENWREVINVKPLEIASFHLCHIFLRLGKLSHLPNQLCKTVGCSYPTLKANATSVQAHSLAASPLIQIFSRLYNAEEKKKIKRYLSPGPTYHPGPGKAQKIQPTTPTRPATFTPNPSKFIALTTRPPPSSLSWPPPSIPHSPPSTHPFPAI